MTNLLLDSRRHEKGEEKGGGGGSSSSGAGFGSAADEAPSSSMQRRRRGQQGGEPARGGRGSSDDKDDSGTVTGDRQGPVDDLNGEATVGRSQEEALLQTLTRLLRCFLTSPSDAARDDVLQFFLQDGDNSTHFGGGGSDPVDILWAQDPESCRILRVCDPVPLSRPSLLGRQNPRGRPPPPRLLLSVATRPPVRPVNTLIECLLESSRWNVHVRQLLVELVTHCPQILEYTARGAAATPPRVDSNRDGTEDDDDVPPTFLHVAVQRAYYSSIEMIQLFATPHQALIQSSTLGWTPLHWCPFVPHSITTFLLQLQPRAALVMDHVGRLPIHHYMDRPWNWNGSVLDGLVDAYPESLSVMDPVTNQPPIVRILHYACRRKVSPNDDLLLLQWVSRMLRERTPRALHDPTLRVPVLDDRRRRRPSPDHDDDNDNDEEVEARFETALQFVCHHCPRVELLEPLIEACPIALAASWRTRCRRGRAVMERGAGSHPRVVATVRRDAPVDDDIRADVDGAMNDDEEHDTVNNDSNDEGSWHQHGIPMEQVGKNPTMLPSNDDGLAKAVQLADRETNAMFVALLEALLASPLRGPVLERIVAHCPGIDAMHHPLGAVRMMMDGGSIHRASTAAADITSAAVRADVIHLPCVQELLHASSTFRDCATGLYRMNRHPDVTRYFAHSVSWEDGDSTPSSSPQLTDPLVVLRALRALQHCSGGNLDSMHIKLRSNPLLSICFWRAHHQFRSPVLM